MRRNLVVVSLLLGSIVASFGLTGPGQALSLGPQADATAPTAQIAAMSATVDVRDYSFTDRSSGTKTTTIAVGGTVTWDWRAGIHQVRHEPAGTLGIPLEGANLFTSPIKWNYDGRQGITWSHGFDVPGAYPYLCTIHDNMDGLVWVLA